MPATTNDIRFMQRALELAVATSGLASPNPQVGCVLVSTKSNPEGEIIAEGAHIYAERDHAEVVALKQARALGIDTTGTTAYVTLEPCSHQGRTGPCADALIAANTARCVIATVDPNPLVSGKGIAKLRAANVEVTLGVCEQQARDLNEAYAHFIQTRIPFITLKAALSVDGKLAPPPTTRISNKPHWLTSLAARSEVHNLRHASDAILTGIGTVLADDPALTDRSEILGVPRPRRRPLLRVVLDTHLRIPLESQLVRSASKDLLILCGTSAPAAKLASLENLGAEVEPIVSHAGRLSLPAVLEALADRAILSVMLECGAHLNGSFLTQGLVDKAVLFYSETELGDSAIPFATGIPSPFLFEQQLRRTSRATFGKDSCLTGYLTSPWQHLEGSPLSPAP